jgi:DNA-binding response OmpR family regulator
MTRILSIGPTPETLAARNRALAKSGHDVRAAATRYDAFALAKSQHFDLVLLCNEFLPAYASQLASELRQLLGDTTVIRLSAGSESATDEIEEVIRHQKIRPRAA